MSRRSPIPPALPWDRARPGLERAYRIDPDGLTGPTRGEAHGRYWRPVGLGWFRPVEPPGSVEQRLIEVSYRAPVDSAITGWASLRWHGGRWFTGDGADGSWLDVPATCLGSHRDRRPGIAFTKERLQPGEVTRVDGLQVTTPVRSVVFEMRHAAAMPAAVRLLDMACFNDLVSLDEVAREVARCVAWTGIQQAREALALADENAWSPAEVDFRLLWTQVGQLGPVLCNQPVFDLRGRHLVTPDLLDPVAGVIGEYQGVHHFERSQRRRDVTRETLLRDHGLEYVERIAGEEPTRFLIRLRSAYARAARQPSSHRRWTIEQPPTWPARETVAQRRALTPHQRAVLLGHRRLDSAA